MNAFRMTPDEIQRWERDGYFVRENVFSDEKTIIYDKWPKTLSPGSEECLWAHIDRNALVRDGKTRDQVYTVCTRSITPVASSRSSSRVRDPRLTDPLVDILGPDILGINKPLHLESSRNRLGLPVAPRQIYFGKRFKRRRPSALGRPLTPQTAKRGAYT